MTASSKPVPMAPTDAPLVTKTMVPIKVISTTSTLVRESISAFSWAKVSTRCFAISLSPNWYAKLSTYSTKRSQHAYFIATPHHSTQESVHPRVTTCFAVCLGTARTAPFPLTGILSRPCTSIVAVSPATGLPSRDSGCFGCFNRCPVVVLLATYSTQGHVYTCMDNIGAAWCGRLYSS